MSEFLILMIVATAAGLLRGFTGFGSSMIMAPIFSTVMEPGKAIACVLALEGAITLQFIPAAAKSADWRRMGTMAIAACAAIPVGTAVLLNVDAQMMRRFIGAVVLVFVVLMALGLKFRGTAGMWSTALTGATSGFLSGSTGMGGPPAILYLLAGSAAAERNRANIIVFLGAVIFFTLGNLIVVGVVTREVWIKVAFLFPVFMASGWIGSRMFSRSKEVLYRRIALATLFAVGVAAVSL